jgi:hypothetical protein
MNKPHVTQLLDLLNKPALITWANKQGLAGVNIAEIRNRTKAIGTSMHSQIESGAFDDPVHAGNFARFIADKEIVATERKIETEWFVGRYDVLLRYRGLLWMCDYKKSRRHRVYFEHALQLVAYAMAEPADKFAIVATPDFAFIEMKMTDAQRNKYESILINLSMIYTLRKEIEASA